MTRVVWLLVRCVAVVTLVTVVLLAAGSGGRVLDVLDPLLPDGWALPSPDASSTRTEVVVATVVGSVVAVVRPASAVVRQLVTLLHELGHTVVAAALGARPRGVVLRHDASGHATARWIGRPGWRRRVALAIVAVTGLPAPAVAAAAAAALLGLVGPEVVLWCLAGAGVTVAVLARSAWSLLVPGLVAAGALVAVRDEAEPWAASLVVVVVVATVVRASLDAVRALRRPLAAGDDARVVGRNLKLPARAVQTVKVLAVVGVSAWTVRLLLSVSATG